MAEVSESAMCLSQAIQGIDDDNLKKRSAMVILNSSPSKIGELASRSSLDTDYLVEAALEIVTGDIQFFKYTMPCIADFWMRLESLDGAPPYEINVRAAQAVAASMDAEGVPDDKFRKLSEAEDWQSRLLAGWGVRDREGSIAEKVRDVLSKDPFSDDNGYFLVRESVGNYD